MTDVGIFRVWDPDKRAYMTQTYESQAAGGGGGDGAVRTLGPFTFAYDTPGLNDGVEFYTPTLDDVLVDAFVTVRVGFNGTTPKFDFGDAASSAGHGLFDFVGNPPAVSIGWPASSYPAQFYTGGSSLSTAHANAYSMQAIFRVAGPIKLWVSTDGVRGGPAVGGTAGQGELYLLVATPALPG